MNRTTAIKLLAGVFGGLMSRGVSVAQIATNDEGETEDTGGFYDGPPVAWISKGPAKKRTKAELAVLRLDWEACAAETRESNARNGITFQGLPCKSLTPEYRERGTAKLNIDLNVIAGISITMGEKEVFITKQELWEALKP